MSRSARLTPPARQAAESLGQGHEPDAGIGGLQFRNDRDEWELTEAGEAWAEAMPYSRNGHSGYQILWNPAVAEQLKEVA
jgi:hypothetical protein